MENKDIRILAIGLVTIVVIAAVIVNLNNQISSPAIKELSTLNSMMQQKDIEIKKLMKQLRVKQTELSNAKLALEDANKKLGSVKAAVEQPPA